MPGAAGRLRFAHVLIRDTLYESLPSARRARLHRAAVEAIETPRPIPAAPRRARSPRARRRRLESGRSATPAAPATGRSSCFAYEEAARLYRLALRSSTADSRWTRSPARAAAGAGRCADAGRQHRRREGDVPLGRRSGAATRGCPSCWRAPRSATGAGPAGSGPATTTASCRCSRRRCRLSATERHAAPGEAARTPRRSAPRPAVARAADVAQPSRPSRSPAGSVTRRRWPTRSPHASWPPGDPTRTSSLAIADEVDPAGGGDRRDRDDRARRPDAAGHRRWLTLRGRRCLRGGRRVRRPGRRDRSEPARAVAGHHAVHDQGALPGRLRGGRAAGGAGLRSGQARRSDADCSYRLTLFVLRREQGRLAEIEDLLRDAVDTYPGYRSFRCFVPLLDCELGREDAARRAFDELAAAGLRRAAARQRVAVLPLAARRGRGAPARPRPRGGALPAAAPVRARERAGRGRGRARPRRALPRASSPRPPVAGTRRPRTSRTRSR